MDSKISLEVVSKLVEEYKDVKVRHLNIVGIFSVIEFYTNYKNSLARLSYAALASNAVITVIPPRSFRYGDPHSVNSGYGKEINSSDLAYRLKLEHVHEGREGCPPLSILEIYGITIARDLVALGRISQENFVFLMKGWDQIE